MSHYLCDGLTVTPGPTLFSRPAILQNRRGQDSINFMTISVVCRYLLEAIQSMNGLHT